MKPHFATINRPFVIHLPAFQLDVFHFNCILKHSSFKTKSRLSLSLSLLLCVYRQCGYDFRNHFLSDLVNDGADYFGKIACF